MGAAQLGRRGAAAEGQRQLELVAQQLRAPAGAPASPPAARPQSAGRPTSTASAPSASAIATSTPRRMPPSTSTGGAPVDRVDHLGQGVGGGQRAVELAAAVVGDDDAGGAVLDRQLRVLGGQQRP